MNGVYIPKQNIIDDIRGKSRSIIFL